MNDLIKKEEIRDIVEEVCDRISNEVVDKMHYARRMILNGFSIDEIMDILEFSNKTANNTIREMLETMPQDNWEA